MTNDPPLDSHTRGGCLPNLRLLAGPPELQGAGSKSAGCKMNHRRIAVMANGREVVVVAEKLTRDYAVIINGVRSRSVYAESEWEECAQMMVKNRHGEIKEWKK